MVLGHDQLADHPACLSHVQLVAPMSVVGIFIFRIAPFQHFGTHELRHTFVVSQEIKQPLRIILVRFPDLRTTGIIRFGVFPVHPDHIGRDTAAVINIGFGNVVNSQKIVAVVSPDAAPVKRMVQSIKGTRSLIDATQGRKTKAVIVTSDDYLVLSALQPETIARRFAEIYENEDKGETHE